MEGRIIFYLEGLLDRLPFLNQLHNIVDVPEPRFQPRNHRRGHADSRIDASKIISNDIKAYHVDVVYQLL